MIGESNSEPLETARELEAARIIKRNDAYRGVKSGKLPHYIVGVKGGGIRFRRSEVLAALRVPANAKA